MSGTIGILGGELWHADFSMAMLHHQAPPDTKLIATKSVDIVGNMNSMVRGMRGEWLWVLGTDHVMDFDLCRKLLDELARPEVDIVFPVCLKRSPPYDPVIYSHQNEDGDYVGYTNLPTRGLHPVWAAGSAGMMVKRWVLEKIGGENGPWFWSEGGLNEDLSFCAAARDIGARLWVRTDALLGHISQVSIWPEVRDGEWGMSMHLGNGEKMPLRRIVDPDLVGQHT